MREAFSFLEPEKNIPEPRRNHRCDLSLLRSHSKITENKEGLELWKQRNVILLGKIEVCKKILKKLSNDE